MLFADSSYFIALWTPEDEHYGEATSIDRKLSETGWARGLGDLMTCLPMACEVAEVISHRRGPLEGARAYSSVMNNCRVIRPTERDIQFAFDRTFSLYAGLPKKRRRLGMTDSIGVAIMRRFKILRILSFDEGFDLVPDIRRIRLVVVGAEAVLSEDR